MHCVRGAGSHPYSSSVVLLSDSTCRRAALTRARHQREGDAGGWSGQALGETVRSTVRSEQRFDG